MMKKLKKFGAHLVQAIYSLLIPAAFHCDQASVWGPKVAKYEVLIMCNNFSFEYRVALRSEFHVPPVDVNVCDCRMDCSDKMHTAQDGDQ
jgi:hypothetical protein